MTQKARIFHDGAWHNCEYSYSKIDGGHLLRILSPYRINIAFPSQTEQQPHAEPEQKQVIQSDLAKRLNDLPTLESFVARAKNHPILGRGKHWRDISSLFGINEPEQAFCEQCGEIVTSVTAKYCSSACKQAAYRERKARNNRNKRNTGRKAA